MSQELRGQWAAEDAQTARQNSLPRRLLADLLVSAAQGVTSLGQSVVGLANLPSRGYAGKLLEDYAGYDGQSTNQALESLYTPDQQAANREAEDAQGFIPTVAAGLTNPSTIGHGIIKSLPLMIGGQAIASKLLTTAPKRLGVLSGDLQKIAPGLAVTDSLGVSMGAKLASSAIGEGTVTAGSQAEQIRWKRLLILFMT